MKALRHRHGNDRGSMMMLAVFIALAIAGLAAVMSGRVLTEQKYQEALERETNAYQGAYAQLHMAMNVVTTSDYTPGQGNIILREAIAGINGGTIEDDPSAGEAPSPLAGGTLDPGVSSSKWAELADDYTALATQAAAEGDTVSAAEYTELAGDYTAGSETLQNAGGMRNGFDAEPGTIEWVDHPDDPKFGFIRGTNVRVYRGREYVDRMARLKGVNAPTMPSYAYGGSDAYYVLEAAGRAGDKIRLVSVLVRENEPFSAFVYFQNSGTLNVSGSLRGQVHSNDKVAFYSAGSSYVDSVTAVNGFEYQAGASAGNVDLRDANPAASEISMAEVDFDALRSQAGLYVGNAGLDAEIELMPDGSIVITPYTAPRIDVLPDDDDPDDDEQHVYVAPTALPPVTVYLGEGNAGTIFVDGRITKLKGDLVGRLTIVSTDKVRITGDLRYQDYAGNPAMLHGGDAGQPYVRNPAYTGSSVLGVIAKDDILYTAAMGASSEINGTFMSVEGRVGADGFWADSNGELHKDSVDARETYLSTAQQLTEKAYDLTTGYGTETFIRASLRHLGGIVSRNSIVETYIEMTGGYYDADEPAGQATVTAGFQVGEKLYDVNMISKPPPNYVAIPRPVVFSFVPVIVESAD